jgi:YHS domain-containing protein
VNVEGKTYYGCCAACKDKLRNNAAVRTAVDPITQRPVDKAAAVIGKTDSGKVLYFESEDTFTRYGGRD